MTALDWLEQAEVLGLHGKLSDDAVTLAAVLSEGFTPEAKPGRLRRSSISGRTGWIEWKRYNVTERELRHAGLLTGRGLQIRPYRYHFHNQEGR